MADTVATTEAVAPATGASPVAKKSKSSAATIAKKPRVKPTHPPTAEMVYSAIKSLKERSGSSLQAIKKYLTSNYKIDAEKLAPFIKKYLKGAVTSGKLIQTKGKGASGSFKLAVKESAAAKSSTAAKKKKVADKKPKAAKKVTSTAAKKKPATAAKKATKVAGGAEKKKSSAATAKVAKVKSSVKAAKSPKQKPTKATKKEAVKKPKTPKPKKATATKKAATGAAKKPVAPKKK